MSGFVLLVVGSPSVILVHGTGFSSKQMMLCWDSSRIMFIKYMMVVRKQACFLEPVCCNSWCCQFQVSFPNQSSNMSVQQLFWMVLQPNFYLLCVVCLQRLHEGNSERLQFRSAMEGKTNNEHFPYTVKHLDIPQMRIVTIQCQDNGIFFR